MANKLALTVCCRAALGVGGGQPQITANLSRWCSGSPVREAHDATCRRSSGTGAARTNGWPDGPRPVSGMGSLPRWLSMQISRRSSLTARLCVRTSMLPAHPKKGDQALRHSRRGLSAKIRALVDGLGMLAKFRLTGGQAGDRPGALPLGDVIPGGRQSIRCGRADRASAHARFAGRHSESHQSSGAA